MRRASCIVALRWMAMAWAALLYGGTAGAAQWPELREWQAQGGGENDAAVLAVAEKYAFVPGVPGALSNGEAWFKYLRKTRGVRRERIVCLRNEEVVKEAPEEKGRPSIFCRCRCRCGCSLHALLPP